MRDLLGIAFIEASSYRKCTNVLVTDVFLSTLSCHLCSRAEARPVRLLQIDRMEQKDGLQTYSISFCVNLSFANFSH